MNSMEMYQHDSARVFRFVLRGALEGRWVQELHPCCLKTVCDKLAATAGRGSSWAVSMLGAAVRE